ncbi:hypothetical protein CBR_g19875 [Chara braunii]|uniref:Uncharacterized protein n=1 Tax=Chara braunii TaxID=69332 RepID=A0A388KYW2_CHABU|nr:hypothetical protein CBR_g19875 [Chara braunii]|eukprot:GBG75239.1 hypothetical protein CBR_g19875 [Chara braunii]
METVTRSPMAGKVYLAPRSLIDSQLSVLCAKLFPASSATELTSDSAKTKSGNKRVQTASPSPPSSEKPAVNGRVEGLRNSDAELMELQTARSVEPAVDVLNLKKMNEDLRSQVQAKEVEMEIERRKWEAAVVRLQYERDQARARLAAAKDKLQGGEDKIGLGETLVERVKEEKEATLIKLHRMHEAAETMVKAVKKEKELVLADVERTQKEAEETRSVLAKEAGLEELARSQKELRQLLEKAKREKEGSMEEMEKKAEAYMDMARKEREAVVGDIRRMEVTVGGWLETARKENEMVMRELERVRLNAEMLLEKIKKEKEAASHKVRRMFEGGEEMLEAVRRGRDAGKAEIFKLQTVLKEVQKKVGGVKRGLAGGLPLFSSRKLGGGRDEKRARGGDRGSKGVAGSAEEGDMVRRGSGAMGGWLEENGVGSYEALGKEMAGPRVGGPGGDEGGCNSSGGVTKRGSEESLKRASETDECEQRGYKLKISRSGVESGEAGGTRWWSHCSPIRRENHPAGVLENGAVMDMRETEAGPGVNGAAGGIRSEGRRREEEDCGQPREAAEQAGSQVGATGWSEACHGVLPSTEVLKPALAENLMEPGSWHVHTGIGW